MKWAKQKTGFTIVELLIVVVVIAILASITVVAYNGIRQRAVASALQNDVSSAVKKVETVKVASGTGTYPATLAAAGLSAESVNYYYAESANTYCIEAREGTAVYSAVSKDKAVLEGDCGQNGLIGWWQMNNTASDSSRSGFNGTINNTSGAPGQNGQPDSSIFFSSASNSVFEVPNNNVLSNDPETFSFWVHPFSWTSATASAFISKRVGTGSGYFISYYNANNGMIIDCGSGNSPNRWLVANSPSLNEWTHIVVTCSEATGLKLYMNGVLTNSRGTVDRSSFSSTSNFRIGRDGSGYVLDGRMDDVRIFNRVITAEEVQNLYTSGAR